MSQRRHAAPDTPAPWYRALEEIRQAREAARARGELPAAQEEEPSCPSCHGAEWVKAATYDQTGEIVPCLRCAGGREAARRHHARVLGQTGLEDLRDRTFASMPPLPGQELPWQGGAAWARAATGWLWIFGETHTGKSRLAQAVANARYDAGDRVWYREVPRLLDELRDAYRSEETTFHGMLSAVRDVPVLVMDDLGKEQMTPWSRDKLFQIINHRMERLVPTVTTTNWTMEELRAEMPRVYWRVLDRAKCTILPFTNPPIDKSGEDQ